MPDADAANQEQNPKHGQCRCGQVTFTATTPSLLTMACHCKGCQRMTASAFSLSEMFSGDQFKVTQGEPVQGGMKASPAHYVCPNCSSWLYTRIETPSGELVNVRSTLFEETSDAPPFIETCTAEKLPWVEVKARHSFAHFPTPEDFYSLVGEFGAMRT